MTLALLLALAPVSAAAAGDCSGMPSLRDNKSADLASDACAFACGEARYRTSVTFAWPA